MPENLPVLLISFVLGLAAGAIMFRADFCMTAAFRDWFLFRSHTFLAALLILVVASAVLFEAVRLAGGLTRYPFPLLAHPSIANLLGGVLFGVGMVLAGGCVVGILYKIGSGCVLCLWGLAGLLLGSALFAEFFPFWSDFTRSTRLSEALTLPQLFGIAPAFLVVPLLLAIGILFRRHPGCFSAGQDWSAVKGYIPPCVAALLLAGIGLFSFWLLGMPMGVTTSYAKVAGFCERLFLPGHFAALDFFRAQPLKGFAPPLASSPLSGGPAPVFDGIALIQYPLIAGIVGGSALAALSVGEWRLKRGAPWRQRLWVLAGGTLMGLASRMAGGCNIWHLWGGLPVFALSSLLFAVGLFPGAWLGAKILTRWILPAESQGLS